MSVNYQEWYNSNEGRSYPFKEDSALVARNGNRLPDNLIVDMNISAPSAHSSNIRCSCIKVTPLIISITIVSDTAGLFIGTFERLNTQTYRAFPLTALVDGVQGWITFGSYTTDAVEIYKFDNVNDSLLDMRVITQVDVSPVSKILKVGEVTSHYVSKVVELVNGSNVEITGDGDSVIYIDLLNPESFVGPCNTKLDRTAERLSLHSINNIKPNADGQITLIFDGEVG